MLTAIIIDDIEKARIALRSDLESYANEIKLIGEAESVASGISLINETSPDIVFLDIRMGDGSGFDLIAKLREKGEINFSVIFTTAYDEYAIKAFRYSATDYLLKPIDPDDLHQAIEKVKNTRSSKTSMPFDQLNLLIESMKGISSGPKRIALSSADKVQVVNVSDIIRCMSEGNYTIFYLAGKKQILVTKTMKEFEELLPEQDFVRVHHSHLINVQHLKEFVKTDGGYAVMDDGAQVPVSVRKKEQLMKILGL